MSLLFVLIAATATVPFEPVSVGQIGNWKRRIEERCLKSRFPQECAASGWAAYGSGYALSTCRLGRDQNRKNMYRYRYRNNGATQSEIDEFCGDLATACETNWRVFYKRSRSAAFKEDEPIDVESMLKRLTHHCYDKSSY